MVSSKSREEGRSATSRAALPSDLVAEFEEIRQEVIRLGSLIPMPKVFGAEGHHFRLNPTLRREDVSHFEEEHRIRLPLDYVAFLTLVGNGGAGPSYGVFKLGEVDDLSKFRHWEENDSMVGTLSQPFPHTEAWNDQTGRPVFDSSREKDQAYEYQYMSEINAWEEAHYFNPKVVNGAIPICHCGCARREWLVVTGSEAGHIWEDSRSGDAGLRPLQEQGQQRVRFSQWYRLWLEGVLSEVRKGGYSAHRSVACILAVRRFLFRRSVRGH